MDNKSIYQAMSEEIIAEAKNEIDALLEEVKNYEDEALSSLKEDAKRDAELRLKQELDEMHLEAATEISALNSEQMKKLIEKRDEYVKVVFDEVRKQVIDFTHSSEYVAFLEKKAKEAAASHLEEVVIYLKKEDMQYQDQVVKAYGKEVKVEATDKIEIGGLIVEDLTSHLVLDETLEFALNVQKEWFNMHSGLVIR